LMNTVSSAAWLVANRGNSRRNRKILRFCINPRLLASWLIPDSVAK
jgi:hypothetical protein